MAVHALALAKVHRLQGLQVDRRVGDKEQVLAAFGIGDAGIDHRNRGDPGHHEQVQGVDLVESVNAGVLGGIADVIRVGQIGKAVVSAGKRIGTHGGTIGGRTRGGRQVLDGDEIGAVVDRKLDMVGLALVHGEIFEHFDHIALEAHHQVEMVGRVQRAVLDGNRELIAPDPFVYGQNTQGVGRCGLPVRQHGGGFYGREGIPIGRICEVGDAVDIEHRAAVVEKGPGRIGQVAFVDVGPEAVDELLPAGDQHRAVYGAFFGHAHHGRRGGRDLLHIEGKIRFPGVDPGRKIGRHGYFLRLAWPALVSSVGGFFRSGRFILGRGTAGGKVGDAHQAAFGRGLDFCGKVLSGDALFLPRAKVQAALSAKLECERLEL